MNDGSKDKQGRISRFEKVYWIFAGTAALVVLGLWLVESLLEGPREDFTAQMERIAGELPIFDAHDPPSDTDILENGPANGFVRFLSGTDPQFFY